MVHGKSLANKIASLLLAALLLFGLTACGEALPEAGSYRCVAAEAEGFALDVAELYPDGAVITLGSGGQGVLSEGERSGTLRWSLSGTQITVTMGGVRAKGTLSGDLLVLTMGDSGVTLTFAREGADFPPDEPSAPDAEQLDFWCGDWFGRWTIRGSSGDFADTWYDCFASFAYSPGDGHLLLTLWDEDGAKASPMGAAELSLEPGLTAAGAAVSVKGNFWFADIGPGEWTFEPGESEYEHMLVLRGRHESEKENFDYEIVLRPWGQSWDDVEAADPFALPFRYEWYQQQIREGRPMPERLEDPA